MKRLILITLFALPVVAFGQGLNVKAGDDFPAIPIMGIINGPAKQVDINAKADKKFYVLNFWGTWCSPCIPEMDDLGKLQKANAGKMQVIAISNDPVEKLRKYLVNKPTTVLLASDTTFILYDVFSLSSVGHSVIVDGNKKIVAIMKTHSVTQGLMDSLYRGIPVRSNADIKEKPITNPDNIFAVDSTLSESFTLRSYMIGQRSMMRGYGDKTIFAKRRLTFVNTGVTTMYKHAYGIVSSNQIIYEVDQKKIENYSDKTTLYCVDILVRPEEKDSLLVILQKRLNALLPVKARIEYKTIPVYVLSNNGAQLTASDKDKSYGFSGAGYEGTGVTVADFANDYLSNELDLPVVDESGLAGKFNIKTSLDMRTMKNVIASVNALGLKLEKQERKMKMQVLY